MTEKPITFKDPWGFSKYDVFRTCHAKFKYQFIDRLPQGSSPAMERGGDMHKNIENYLNGWSKDLLPSVENWQEAFDSLKLKNFKGEQSIGINKDWKLLPNWFAKSTWLRVKMDAYYIQDKKMRVIDFKSGKYRIPSTDQIEIYAIAGISIDPTVEEVDAEFWFLDADEVYTVSYTRDQLIALRKKYEGLVAPIYTEELWEPSPSNECRWCPYSRTKNGPCRY